MADLSRNLNLVAKAKGIEAMVKDLFSVGDAAKKAGKEGSDSFASMAKSAGATALAIGGLYAAAIAGIKEPIKAWQDWQKEMLNTNRMMGLTDSQLKVFESRMLSLANGPLGSVPDLLNGLTEGLYGYASATGEITNQSAAMQDMTTFAEAAAVSQSDLNTVVTQGAKIMSVFGIKQGNANVVIEQAMQAEKLAVATFQEMTDATYAASGGFNLLGADAATAMGAIATITKVAGKDANEAATMLNMFNSRISANKDALIEAGVTATEWPDILQQISEKGLLASDMFKELAGPRYVPALTALAQHSDMLKDSIDQVRNSTGNLEEAWSAYNSQTMTESIRIENEHQAKMIEMGQELEKFKPGLDEFQSWMSLTLAQLAGFFMDNQELCVGAILAIKGAFDLLKTSSPLGWLELAIGAITMLVSLFDDPLNGMIANAQEMKKLTEEQLANISTTRDQVAAELSAAIAHGESAERIDQLRDSYNGLTGAQKQLIELRAMEAANLSALEMEKSAVDAITEVISGRYEEALGRINTSYIRGLVSIGDSVKATQALTDLQTQIVMAQGDENKMRAALLDYFVQELGMDRDKAMMMMERLNSEEEILAFVASQGKAIQQQGIHIGAINELEKIRSALNSFMHISEKGITQELEKQLGLINQQNLARGGGKAGKVAGVTGTETGGVGEVSGGAGGAAGGEKVDSKELAAAEALLQQRGTDTTGWSNQKKIDFYKEYLRRQAEQPEEEVGNAGDRATAIKESIEDESSLYWDADTKRYLNQAELAKKNATEELNRQEKIASRFTDILMTGFTKGPEAMKDMIVNMLLDIAKNALFMLILTALSGGTAGFGASGWLGKLFGFAEGGYVTQATPSLTGEEGPEYILPEKTLAKNVAKHGPMGAAAALAEVRGQSLNMGNQQQQNYSPNINVSTPEPTLIPIIDSEGLAISVQYGNKKIAAKRGL